MSASGEDQTRMSRSAEVITKQTVTLSGSDDPNSYAVYGRDVTVAIPPIAEHVSGSNKVGVSYICTNSCFYLHNVILISTYHKESFKL